MLNIVVILIVLLLGGYLIFSKYLANSESWKATITPLSSIMGSGFLVSAPLLAGVVGDLAVICMAVLLTFAYGIGSAIRFNIKHFEPIENNDLGAVQGIAFASRLVLSGAYFISVIYYIQLLSAFVLNALGIHSVLGGHILTTSILLVICGFGIWRGLAELEVLEKYTISLNLAMIGALLIALATYNVKLLVAGSWQMPAISSDITTQDVRILLGLLIIVQGFETSRYLERIRIDCVSEERTNHNLIRGWTSPSL
ncbi:hypothetical protein [Desulfogranum japonicum]|uniref:hypothetical protein n=1 Tax=Desulfogranum japonicum TaxID=231447 RepID=UPI00041266AF|nr:hypothetical protein [Desulfogranum japonicum]